MMAQEPLDLHAAYSVSRKALARWSVERLTLERRPDGSTAAAFRYEGTTCSDMGRPLEFIYEVTLGPRDDGYPIREERCAPAATDEGHVYMCRYRAAAVQLMAAIASEKPLLGQRLDHVLTRALPESVASCYCEAGSRERKWVLVLETIHFALAEWERAMQHSPLTGQAGTR